jgi:hypothetical protein
VTALIDLYRVDHTALVDYIVRTYAVGIGGHGAFGNAHHKRRQTIADRLRLYRDEAAVPIGRIIDQIYDTDTNKADLKRFIDVAKEQNVSARIVNELASLYDRPAVRAIKTEDQVKFHEEEKRLKLHFFHQEGHRLTNLCNETLLWQFKGVNDQTSLRLVTPDTFDAIEDPRDRLVPAGFVLDAFPITALPPEMASKLPHYECWDDTYRYLISAEGKLVDEVGTPVTRPLEHGLGRIPGVLFHRREPTSAILDASTGEDIKAAHLGVALLNILIMRLAKSQGEQHPVLTGELARMASSQTLHPERPMALPPGVTIELLQMISDPEHYLKAKRDKLASVGARYGLAYETFMLEFGSDTGSGRSYQMRREKLTELRLEQRTRALAHEALVMKLIGFDPAGMRVDFQEQAIPLDAQEEVDLLIAKMKLGLDSPIAFLMRKDPDLSRDEAVMLLKTNLRDYAGLVQWVRALNVPGDADASNPGRSPEENGAMGGAAKNGDGQAKKRSKDELRAVVREALNAA